MTSSPHSGINLEEFRQMADRAGLGMTTEELEELKPLYDLYSQYSYLLHNIDLGSEEIDLTFHPHRPQIFNG